MKFVKKFLSLLCTVAMISTMVVSVAQAADTSLGLSHDKEKSSDNKLVIDVIGTLDDTLHTTGYSVTLDLSALEGYVTYVKDNFVCTKYVSTAGAANVVAAKKTYIINCSQSSADDPIVFSDGKIATIEITLDKPIDKEIAIGLTAGKVSYYDWEASSTKSYNPTLQAVTIPAPAPTAVVTTIDVTGAATVNENEEATYAATVKDQNGDVMDAETVTWSVDNADVATIDENGKLTAKEVAADTEITVIATSTTKTDVKGTLKVTVKDTTPAVTDPEVVLTVEAGKDTAAGAYTFFYKAVVTKGSEAVTAADVTITSGKNARKAYLSEALLANMENVGGSFTFYVGNKTAYANRAFSGVASVTANKTVTTDAVDYTTPAAE